MSINPFPYVNTSLGVNYITFSLIFNGSNYNFNNGVGSPTTMSPDPNVLNEVDLVTFENDPHFVNFHLFSFPFNISIEGPCTT